MICKLAIVLLACVAILSLGLILSPVFDRFDNGAAFFSGKVRVSLRDDILHFSRETFSIGQTPYERHALGVPWAIEYTRFVSHGFFSLPRGRPVVRGWRLDIHLWVVSLVCGAYPLLTLVHGPVRRWRRRRNGQCVRCGYNLFGNETGMCPECGNKLNECDVARMA